MASVGYNKERLQIFHDKQSNKDYVFTHTEENTVLPLDYYSDDALFYFTHPVPQIKQQKFLLIV